MRAIQVQLEHEPAILAGVVAGALGAAHAARRRAPLSVVLAPLAAGVVTGSLARAAVTPVRKVRDPELLRPPWLLEERPQPAAPAIVEARIAVGQPSEQKAPAPGT